MKILIVMEYFYPHFGGVEQVFYEVGQRLSLSNEITILTTSEKNRKSIEEKLILVSKDSGGFAKYYRMGKMRVVRIWTPEILKRYLFPFFSFPHLFFLAREADLIHCANNYTVAFSCFFVAKLLKKPVTISIWEIWGRLWFKFYPLISIFFLTYEKLLLSLPFDLFITPSKFVAGQLNHVNKSKKEIVYLGARSLKGRKKNASLLRKKYGAQSKYIYFFWGRYGKSKGTNLLIEAYARLTKKYKDTCLLLVVSNLDNQIKKQIEKILQKHNIKSRTVLLPGQNDTQLADHIMLADCIVCPDITISFGLSALEASIARKPIVTTTGGALKEVSYGKVIYVKPDSAASLSEGLDGAYKNRFKKIREKHFSWDKTAGGYQRIFKRLL